MKCIILAGGFATRLWPLTESKAKPLLHIKDKPLISHIVDGLPEDVEVIVSTNAAFEEDFKQWAASYSGRSIQIFVEDSMEDDKKKGALGATAMVISDLGIQEDLMLIAGDNYFGFKMQDFIDAFDGNPILAAYDIKELDKAKQFGVVVASGGKVVEFQEKPAEPKSTLVSTGCYLFRAANLVDIQTYAREHSDDLGGVFEHLMQKGVAVDVFSFDNDWYDIGSFDAYLKANEHLLGGEQIEASGVVKSGENELIGGVYMGPGAQIENSTLENVIVLKNVKIKNCVIRNCVIDEDSDLENIDLNRQMIRQKSCIRK